jgi:TPR repeat protein
MEKAAGQGHAYAMETLGSIHIVRKGYEQAMQWYTKGAEAGLPGAMYKLGSMLDQGQGVAAPPDCLAAADWFRPAADAGHRAAANNLSGMYSLGRGWAWQILPATSALDRNDSPPHRRPSFLWLRSITRRGEHYLPGPRARRHAQQPDGDEVDAQGRRERPCHGLLETRSTHVP